MELSHRCYEDLSFDVGINRDKREVFDMASYVKLKKGGLVLNAERDGKPVSDVVFVNGVKVGETPFSGSVAVCARVEIGSGREMVDVKLKHNEKVTYTAKSSNYKPPVSTGSGFATQVDTKRMPPTKGEYEKQSEFEARKAKWEKEYGENSDAFCEEQRKFAAANFAASLKNKVKENALLTEAIVALNKCLERTPSPDMRKRVEHNKDVLEKRVGEVNKSW